MSEMGRVQSLLETISPFFPFFSFAVLFGSWALGPDLLFTPPVGCCLNPLFLVIFMFCLFICYILFDVI
jgi:hypothetical protein